MRPEELEERLSDTERVLGLHAKRLQALEEREISQASKPIPPHAAIDYTPHFEELKELLKKHDFGLRALQIYALITSFQQTITKLPKVLPVRHYHHFEARSRGFVIGGIVCLLTAAISVGLCFSLIRENSRLEKSDIKYRMIRQTFQDAALWADSAYYSNPKEAERRVRLLEIKAYSPQ